MKASATFHAVPRDEVHTLEILKQSALHQQGCLQRSTSTCSLETAPSSTMESDEELSPLYDPPNRLLEDDADVLAHKSKAGLLPPMLPFVSSEEEVDDDEAPFTLDHQQRDKEGKPYKSLVKKVVRFHHEDEGIVYPTKLTPDEVASHESKVARKLETKILLDKNSLRSKVTFGSLHIHEFPFCLGDHPDCKGSGPPLCLDYDPPHDDDCKEYTVAVDEYESTRQPRRKELRIPPHTRRYWLLKQAPCRRTCGQQMREAQEAAQRVQKQRLRSLRLHEVEGLQIAQQAVSRKLKRVLLGKNDSNDLAARWCQQYKQGLRRSSKATS